MWNTFVAIARRHFSFLETEFDFVAKSEKPPFVIYESSRVGLLVYYDAVGRHELDFRIKRLGQDPRVPAIGPTELMLLSDWPAAEKYRSPFPSTETMLEVEVRRMSELLKKYGSTFLKGDDKDFERIEELRRKREGEMAAGPPF